ncbi:plasmid mobilization relaxosome protein MobC [Campylobacter sp.]|uniref:plasmid mobilization relaxosome protein MobC n=1 Tax=Campylobacter sp. TaxID=205 RepID=UPI002A806494|nr:plasmid mobilization relaxosome protein MobC [Campylobacter sp.]MDY4155032.1 plasmid mobilization relaxosome protein MobC [Campylobacter sp.]MDY4445075.1 plasmid mobilization relaxosome protein MobC [Campylobacter sp.]
MKIRRNMYFDKEEYQIMQNLSKQTGLSKSALLRHLLRSSKYLEMTNKLEKHNNLINEFLAEIHRIGNNINQIAYHLNIDITKHEESKESLKKELAELLPLLKEYKDKAFKATLDIAPKKFKTIKVENE